jgi:hypothetical protein
VEQLGENGEYWMERKGSGLISYSELQGGSQSWCPLGLRVSYCQVYTLARLIIDSDLHDTLRHG